MKNKLNYLLQNVQKNLDNLSEKNVSLLEDAIGIKLPEDYVNIIKEYNGCEGEIGENGWLLLFPIQELLEINKSYELMREIPDYLLFGKDAADTGYAIHKLNKTYHSFGLMSNFKTDPIVFCGNSFVEFLEKIA
jgi:hypothetical protein